MRWDGMKQGGRNGLLVLCCTVTAAWMIHRTDKVQHMVGRYHNEVRTTRKPSRGEASIIIVNFKTLQPPDSRLAASNNELLYPS